jgi:hypothetical protein
VGFAEAFGDPGRCPISVNLSAPALPVSMASNARVARKATPWVAVAFNLRKRAPMDRAALEGPHGVLEYVSFVENTVRSAMAVNVDIG